MLRRYLSLEVCHATTFATQRFTSCYTVRVKESACPFNHFYHCSLRISSSFTSPAPETPRSFLCSSPTRGGQPRRYSRWYCGRFTVVSTHLQLADGRLESRLCGRMPPASQQVLSANAASRRQPHRPATARRVLNLSRWNRTWLRECNQLLHYKCH